MQPAPARSQGRMSDAPLRPPCVILNEPQLAENIGAAARAMANFGLRDLRLVRTAHRIDVQARAEHRREGNADHCFAGTTGY